MRSKREADGTCNVASDQLDQARTYERIQARATPVIVQTLSVLRLDRQVRAEGATWLDRELVGDTPVIKRDAGFGHEVREALARRRPWLIEQDLARAERDRIVYPANLLGRLRVGSLPIRSSKLGTVMTTPIALKPLAVRTREVCELLRVNKHKLYDIMLDGELMSYIDGGSRRITMQSVEDYFTRRLAEAPKPAPYNRASQSGQSDPFSRSIV